MKNAVTVHCPKPSICPNWTVLSIVHPPFRGWTVDGGRTDELTKPTTGGPRNEHC